MVHDLKENTSKNRTLQVTSIAIIGQKCVAITAMNLFKTRGKNVSAVTTIQEPAVHG